MADLKFNRIWASDQNWAYPTDSQTARGLSFLGTEEPTFDLHDAMFKELDLQDEWLYDQVRNACERFGQKVQNDDGSAIDDARDAMANAITNALITQRKADEGGYGIVKMANADTVRAGKEYNQAVSPAHLSEYVTEQNTWQNTRDKPQTATRWPKFDEVTDKPIYGDIIWSNKRDFDANGTASAAVANRVKADGITVAGFLNGDKDGGAYFRSTDGTLIGMTRNDEFDRYKKTAAETYISRDGITFAGFLGGDASNGAYFRASNGEVVGILKTEIFDRFEKDVNGFIGKTKSAAFRDVTSLSWDKLKSGEGEVTTSGVVADLRDAIYQEVSKKVSSDKISTLGLMGDTANIYVKTSTGEYLGIPQKSDFSDGAYMWKSSAKVDGLTGNVKEVMTTAQGVELRNMTVRKVRLGQPSTYDMQSNTNYSLTGGVVSALRITGSVDGSMDSITLRPVQYLINSTWYTAEQV